MISKGANDWNYGLDGACEGGHKEIVNYMISKGAIIELINNVDDLLINYYN